MLVSEVIFLLTCIIALYNEKYKIVRRRLS